MVTIAVTSESADEPRIAVSPDTVKKFTALGAKVRIESGAGARSRFSDDAYRAAGADIVTRPEALYGADILLTVRRPSIEDVAALKPGAIVAGMIDPYGDRGALAALAGTGATVFSMEFMSAPNARKGLTENTDLRHIQPYETAFHNMKRRGGNEP